MWATLSNVSWSTKTFSKSLICNTTSKKVNIFHHTVCDNAPALFGMRISADKLMSGANIYAGQFILPCNRNLFLKIQCASDNCWIKILQSHHFQAIFPTAHPVKFYCLPCIVFHSEHNILVPIYEHISVKALLKNYLLEYPGWVRLVQNSKYFPGSHFYYSWPHVNHEERYGLP